jgi:hypothetical protein
MNMPNRFVAAAGAVLMVIMLAAAPAAAQKGQKGEKSKPVPVQTAPLTVKELLKKYEGKSTSLGILKQVAGDYIVIDNDGTTVIYPLTSIHALRFVKDEEAGTETLEIRLVAD